MIHEKSLEGWGQLVKGNKIANAAPRFIRPVLWEMGMRRVGTPEEVTAMLKVGGGVGGGGGQARAAVPRHGQKVAVLCQDHLVLHS